MEIVKEIEFTKEGVRFYALNRPFFAEYIYHGDGYSFSAKTLMITIYEQKIEKLPRKQRNRKGRGYKYVNVLFKEIEKEVSTRSYGFYGRGRDEKVEEIIKDFFEEKYVLEHLILTQGLNYETDD